MTDPSPLFETISNIDPTVSFSPPLRPFCSNRWLSSSCCKRPKHQGVEPYRARVAAVFARTVASPAWHKKLRKKRSTARRVLRDPRTKAGSKKEKKSIEALQFHHGSCLPATVRERATSSMTRKTWQCQKCGHFMPKHYSWCSFCWGTDVPLASAGNLPPQQQPMQQQPVPQAAPGIWHPPPAPYLAQQAGQTQQSPHGQPQQQW